MQHSHLRQLGDDDDDVDDELRTLRITAAEEAGGERADYGVKGMRE